MALMAGHLIMTHDSTNMQQHGDTQNKGAVNNHSFTATSRTSTLYKNKGQQQADTHHLAGVVERGVGREGDIFTTRLQKWVKIDVSELATYPSKNLFQARL